jgi:energy-coupling factor transporter ATP-binding protein EcfA2
MNVLQEIANWARTLPTWQSDAVRRIFTQSTLSSEDELSLYNMLLSAHDVVDPNAVEITPSPFSSIVDAAPLTQRTVLLKELHSVENVNALVTEQSINFALDGITVIYGENGAGKSGYARVLKHACSAREKSEPILTNISTRAKETPAATVELLVDNEHIAERWQADRPTSESLSHIAVFDSHCARVFLDEANEVVYIPYGLDVFPRMASLFTALKKRVLSALNEIPSTLDQAGEYSTTTAAGRFVRTLDANSDEKQIDALAALVEKAAPRLDELRTIVASGRAESPALKAANLRRLKSRLAQLQVSITTIATALSPERLGNVARLQMNAEVARKAATLASTEAFRNDPLKATGSDPWQLLFEAARSFSETSAYPNEEFPVVRADSVCLLCQQPLNEAAVQRLQRFERFIKENAAKRSVDAEKELRNAEKIVIEMKMSVIEDDPVFLEEIRAYEPTLAKRVEEFFLQANATRCDVLAAVAENRLFTPATALESPSVRIGEAIVALEAQAQIYDNADKPEEFKKLIDELADLEDSARLKQHAELVQKYIWKKQREFNLRRCERALDTTSITRHGSELMDKVVTEQLRTTLTREVEQLGLRSVPVQIRRIGQKGRTKHQIFVSESSKPSGVLSEGEQRLIAISSFLAELEAGGSQSPIVFDDPVSSLDHHFREKVARRLVTESRTRQVILFTHDVVFLLAVEREAAKQRAPLLVQTIIRSSAGPGECIPAGDRPWHACNVKQRVSFLKRIVAPFKRMQAEEPAEYQLRVGDFYGKLRETWERSIEEVLFQDVIQRFRPSIETQRLKKVTIEQTDYVAIESGMSKCSTWMTGHDSSAAIGSPPPNHEEVANDLKALEDFTRAITDRGEKAGKAMGALLKAPDARVSDRRAEVVIEFTSRAAIQTGA